MTARENGAFVLASSAWLSLAACVGAPREPARLAPVMNERSSRAAAPSSSATGSSPVATLSAAPTASAAAPRAVDLGAWTHELQLPVTSLAVGAPRVAALADEPWLLEEGKWRRVPLPASLRPHDGERDLARVYFGRDDRPRIMGERRGPGGARQLYLRWKDGRWLAEKNELAKLRDPPAQALFGLLGHDDPEVVCKVGDDCIVKRRTGWKMLRAGDAPFRVELHDGSAWALLEGAVARLDGDKSWTRFAPVPAIGAVGGAFARGEDVWVSEPAAGRLHHLAGGKWTSYDAPGAHPRGMWGTSTSDVWLATDDGVARYDGAAWARVQGPEGPLTEVFGREREVWTAGPSGVWRLSRAPLP